MAKSSRAKKMAKQVYTLVLPALFRKCVPGQTILRISDTSQGLVSDHFEVYKGHTRWKLFFYPNGELKLSKLYTVPSIVEPTSITRALNGVVEFLK